MAQSEATVAEELECLLSIYNTLSNARIVDNNNDNSNNTTDVTLSSSQVCEFFDLLLSLIGTDSSSSRLRYLVFESCPSLIDVILSYPSMTPNQHHASKNYAVILSAVTILTRIITLCKFLSDNDDDEMPYSNNLKLHSLCAEAIQKSDGLSLLLSYLEHSISSSDSSLSEDDETNYSLIRSQCCEAIARVIDGDEKMLLAVMVRGGINILINLLDSEPSPVTRRFTVIALGPFCRMFSSDVLNADGIPILLQRYSLDSSPAVRAMCIEIIAFLFFNHYNHTIIQQNYQNITLTVLKKLNSEKNGDVLDASLRLVDLILRISNDNRQIIQMIEDENGAHLILNCIKLSSSASTIILSLRALRSFIEYSQIDVGYSIIIQFTLLSTLMGVVTNYNSNESQSSDEAEAYEELLCEVGLTLGVFCVRSPSARHALANELGRMPLWSTEIKALLLNILSGGTNNNITKDIILRDINDNRLLNSFDLVSLDVDYDFDSDGDNNDNGNENKWMMISAMILDRQEQRFKNNSSNSNSANEMPHIGTADDVNPLLTRPLLLHALSHVFFNHRFRDNESDEEQQEKEPWVLEEEENNKVNNNRNTSNIKLLEKQALTERSRELAIQSRLGKVQSIIPKINTSVISNSSPPSSIAPTSSTRQRVAVEFGFSRLGADPTSYLRGRQPNYVNQRSPDVDVSSLKINLGFTDVISENVLHILRSVNVVAVNIKKELVILPVRKRAKRATLLSSSNKIKNIIVALNTILNLLQKYGSSTIQDTLAAIKVVEINEFNLINVATELGARYPNINSNSKINNSMNESGSGSKNKMKQSIISSQFRPSVSYRDDDAVDYDSDDSQSTSSESEIGGPQGNSTIKKW